MSPAPETVESVKNRIAEASDEELGVIFFAAVYRLGELGRNARVAIEEALERGLAGDGDEYLSEGVCQLEDVSVLRD